MDYINSKPSSFLFIHLFCAAFFLLQGVVYAQLPKQTFKFDHLGISEGLSQSTVYCIIQDGDGFIWLGTEEGLNRYDGQNVRVYRADPSRPECLPVDYICCLYIDSREQMWIGTGGGGLVLYDRMKDCFTSFVNDSEDSNSLCQNDVWDVCEDHRHRIWIATGNGLDCLNP